MRTVVEVGLGRGLLVVVEVGSGIFPGVGVKSSRTARVGVLSDVLEVDEILEDTDMTSSHPMEDAVSLSKSWYISVGIG